MILHRITTVDFDPNIKSHREAVALFLKRKAWGDSPIRFHQDPNYGSVAEQVRSRLLEWYVAREQITKR